MGKVLFKGNEALAEAALAAGCRFYSGYPITPQTEILEYLSWRMEDVGGVFIQAESELAGVNMVLGASAAGARALTTSAGPGKRRLRKVAKQCVNYGRRVQNSVFECILDNTQCVSLKAVLGDIIDKEADSLRFYYLGNNYKTKVEHMGVDRGTAADSTLIF